MSTTPQVSAPPDTAIPMTEEQKFIFDLKGWLLIPGVLNEQELGPLREHCRALREDPQSIPPEIRYSLAGPAQELLDHPAIVGVLREILGHDPSPDCYGFRCEGSFPQVRRYGDEGIPPHGGGGMAVGPMVYQSRHGRIHSGLTRVVWELNEVEKGAGGTLILSGTHKMNFPIPPEHMQRDSPLYETYACPPGSVLIFTEGLCHSGAKWTSRKNDRLAIFNCYNTISTQFHKMSLPTEVIQSMPPKRQTLFRGVWQADFHTDPPILNHHYSPENQTL